MREAIYDALAAYLEAQAHRRASPICAAHVRALRDDAGAAARRARRLARPASGSTTRPTSGWPTAFAALAKRRARPLLLAYLGFPFFDIATLPLLQGEGLDEFDPIKVDRIAPDDAAAIRAGGAEATLKGIQFNSFGAFFSRAYRENDYLWGRLHGAERMIDIVVSTLPPRARMKPGRVAAIKRARVPRDPRRGGAAADRGPGADRRSCGRRSAEAHLAKPADRGALYDRPAFERIAG